jgi:hypothetical protein
MRALSRAVSLTRHRFLLISVRISARPEVQSLADGSGFLAQWYADGERSGQAFPLFNTGELLFFAYCTEAPMIVPDDATRAVLRERGVGVLSAAS